MASRAPPSCNSSHSTTNTTRLPPCRLRHRHASSSIASRHVHTHGLPNMSANINLSDDHELQVQAYLRFAKLKREQHVREVTSTVRDFKDSKLRPGVRTRTWRRRRHGPCRLHREAGRRRPRAGMPGAAPSCVAQQRLDMRVAALTEPRQQSFVACLTCAHFWAWRGRDVCAGDVQLPGAR